MMMLDRRAAHATGEVAKPYGHERWSAETVTRRTPPSSQPRHLRGALTRPKTSGRAHLGGGFALRCVQRFSVPDVATRRLARAGQPRHQRSGRPGPLVLGATPLNPPTPAADRDRTVSRRSEPSSRAVLMGEQPNPWDRLQPQDATSRHRGAKPRRRCELLGEISLLSPG
jgi:hypothetical protein